jgi:hypothetical protein
MRSTKDIRRSAAQRLRDMFPAATGWDEAYDVVSVHNGLIWL